MIRNLTGTLTTLALAVTLSIAASAAMLETANAGAMASNAEITAAVSGHTIQGSMTKTTFAEFYQADGNIKGKDYTGKWRVANNQMCFTYGDKPEACWSLEINGPAVTLYKDGKVDGNGMILKGNPHNF